MLFPHSPWISAFHLKSFAWLKHVPRAGPQFTPFFFFHLSVYQTLTDFLYWQGSLSHFGSCSLNSGVCLTFCLMDSLQIALEFLVFPYKNGTIPGGPETQFMLNLLRMLHLLTAPILRDLLFHSPEV